MLTFTMKSVDRYESEDGHTMQREEGETPNGNQIGRRWVLRSPAGEWLDIDQYRTDLAQRHSIHLLDSLND